MSIKKKLYDTIDNPESKKLASRVVQWSIMFIIAVNVLSVILETEPLLNERFAQWFYYLEFISVVIFTIEYLIRILACTEKEGYQGAVSGRIKYMLSFIMLIDLFAILPFYLPMFFKLDLRFIRVLRLFRIFRLFKLARYSDSLRVMSKVIRGKKEEIIIAASFTGILLVFSSSMMYFIENQAQPEAFRSIPQAPWWGVATLTTVGYGDIYPITPLGKLFGALIAIFGIGLFALPAGILASGFTDSINQKSKPSICPHCKMEIT